MNLGTLDPNDTLDVTYTMTATAEHSLTGGAQFGQAAFARIGDPFSLAGDPQTGVGSGLSIIGVPVAGLPIPEPSAFALAVLGLIPLFLARRRR